MNEKKIYQEIKQGNFENIKKYLDKNKIKKFNKMLSNVCWKHPEKIIYNFLMYMIKNEKNSPKKVFYYEILNNFLTMVVYWPSHINKNIKIGKKILKSNPENIEIKKLFLEYYFNPDLNEFITKKEIKKIAEDVLKKEPNNQNAKEVLEKIKK